jgi:hypothetical protein
MITPNTTPSMYPRAAPQRASAKAKQFASLSNKHATTERPREILAKGPSVQALGVRVLDQAAETRHRARHADADRHSLRVDTGFTRGGAHELDDRFRARRVTALAAGRHALA